MSVVVRPCVRAASLSRHRAKDKGCCLPIVSYTQRAAWMARGDVKSVLHVS